MADGEDNRRPAVLDYGRPERDPAVVTLPARAAAGVASVGFAWATVWLSYIAYSEDGRSFVTPYWLSILVSFAGTVVCFLTALGVVKSRMPKR